MTVKLDLKPETEAGLQARASARGMALEEYLLSFVEELAGPLMPPDSPQEESAMVVENGLLVYRKWQPLPIEVVDDVIRRGRETRSRHLLGERP